MGAFDGAKAFAATGTGKLIIGIVVVLILTLIIVFWLNMSRSNAAKDITPTTVVVKSTTSGPLTCAFTITTTDPLPDGFTTSSKVKLTIANNNSPYIVSVANVTPAVAPSTSWSFDTAAFPLSGAASTVTTCPADKTQFTKVTLYPKGAPMW